MWARSVAAGLSDELFWASTPREVGALLREMEEREKALARKADLRAGLITSAVYNVNRKQGSRAFKAEDFVPQPVQYVDGKTLRGIMHDWLGKGAAKA